MPLLKRRSKTPVRPITAAAAAGILLAVGFGLGPGNASTTATTYTGCLKGGSISQVAPGGAPAKPCSAGASVISWSKTGPQGPAGPQGAAGADGAAGPQGADGAAGPQGAAGAAGPQGPAGPQGADGAAGPQGPAGPQGADGAAGPQGAAGATGAGVRYRGDFQSDPTGGDYAAGDSVRYAGKAWVATSAPSCNLVIIQGGCVQEGVPGIDVAWKLLVSDGQQGAQGQPGATGPAGPQGSAGLPGLHWLKSNQTVFENSPGTYVRSFCPSGEVVINGDIDEGTNYSARVLNAGPNADGSQGWEALVIPTTGGTGQLTFTVSILCAPAAE